MPAAPAVLVRSQYSQPLTRVRVGSSVPAGGVSLKNSARNVALPEGVVIPILRNPAPNLPTGNVKATAPVLAKGPFTKDVAIAGVVFPVAPTVGKLVVVVVSKPDVRVKVLETVIGISSITSPPVLFIIRSLMVFGIVVANTPVEAPWNS